MAEREQGFQEFSFDEVDRGYNYAIDTCGVRLDFAVLRVVGNHAGAIRKAANGKKAPRAAVTEAIRAYEHRNRTSVSAQRFQAYVRSIAKMLNGRNPKVAAKRQREEELADIRAAS